MTMDVMGNLQLLVRNKTKTVTFDVRRGSGATNEGDTLPPNSGLSYIIQGSGMEDNDIQLSEISD